MVATAQPALPDPGNTHAYPAEANRLLQERARHDATAWKQEQLARRHEATLVKLWDALLRVDRTRVGDKFNVLAALPLESVLVGTPGPEEVLDHGIRRFDTGAPAQGLAPMEWRGLLAGFRDAGYRIVQSEWHHADFKAPPGDPAESTVSVAVHAEHPVLGTRVAVEGDIGVVWSARSDDRGRPLPLRADASRLRVWRRDAPSAFVDRFQFHARSGGETLNLQPVLLHDLDGDGLSEVLLGGCNRILRNRGEFRFEAGVIAPGWRAANEVGVIADFDRDGRPDFLVPGRSRLFLFRGREPGERGPGAGGVAGPFAPPSLLDETSPALPLELPMALTAGDVDGDGDLDAFLAQYKVPYIGGQMPAPYYDANDGHPGFLLLNDGRGNFSDATEAAGLAPKRFRRSYAAALVDLDDDGDLDLLVVSDFAGVDIHLNDGRGRFTDATEKLVDRRHLFGMSATFGDYDGDGRLDFFAAGMASTTARRLGRMGAARADQPEVDRMRPVMAYGNRIYLRTEEAGVGVRYRQPPFADQVARTGWTWGMTTLDFDRDGDRDIFVANGHSSGASTKDHCSDFWCHDIYSPRTRPDPAMVAVFDRVHRGYFDKSESWDGYQKNHLLMNLGRDPGGGAGPAGERFANVAFLLGVADQFDARAAASDDLDGDGRPDLLVVEHDLTRKGQVLHIYQNKLQTENHWIGVRLRDGPGAPSPIGAEVRVKRAGQPDQVARYLTGETLCAQHAPTFLFGLGDRPAVSAVTVTWLNGKTVTLDAPAADRYHDVPARK